MKITLDYIKAPIAKEMEAFEGYFRESMKSHVPLLDKITYYIVKRKGKQIRPMFVFLSAGIAGQINDRTFRAASLIELLHTATLVHDDVVDDSFMRRGFFSINALWKNKIAVLVGDYLLSRGLLLSVDNEDFTLLRIVSNSVKQMSEGELLQIEKARGLDITEDIYYEIIRQKTASLIASCCATGASSAGADAKQTELFRQLGEKVGMAFQIKDDLFDFESTGETGKPKGIDIQERKLTLPLIYALQEVDATTRREMMRVIKKYNTHREKVAWVIDQVKNSGGVAYATQKMMELTRESKEMMDSMPSNRYKQSMIDLIDFTISRKA